MNAWVDIMVPASFFIAVVAAVFIISLFRFKQRKLLAKTTLSLLEQGKSVTPEVIHALGEGRRQSIKDLRLGLILLGSGAAILGFTWVIELPTSGNMNLENAIAALAILPLVMGIVFIGLSKLKLA
ncbi:DUF6249 domain-containing protein [Pseudidiomarina sp. CB1]|uniref:DUF6249 domain-containing protein n=1 Tax=Pseudidiomarina sp. CB1 TaxID=2972484 RepID=UPI0021635813|nr:DUF6249 domain-containing protein [Pseudidiomarina sp. CB1]